MTLDTHRAPSCSISDIKHGRHHAMSTQSSTHTSSIWLLSLTLLIAFMPWVTTVASYSHPALAESLTAAQSIHPALKRCTAPARSADADKLHIRRPVASQRLHQTARNSSVHAQSRALQLPSVRRRRPSKCAAASWSPPKLHAVKNPTLYRVCAPTLRLAERDPATQHPERSRSHLTL